MEEEGEGDRGGELEGTTVLAAFADDRLAGRRVEEDADLVVPDAHGLLEKVILLETTKRPLLPLNKSAIEKSPHSTITSLPDDLLIRILQCVVNEAGNCSKYVAQCVAVCKWFSNLARQIPSLSFFEEVVPDADDTSSSSSLPVDAGALSDGSGSLINGAGDGGDFISDVAVTVLNMDNLRSLRIEETGSHLPRIFGHAMLEQIFCHVGESLEELVLGGSSYSSLHVVFFPIAVIVRRCHRLQRLSLSAANLYIEGVSLGELVTRMALSSNGVRTDTWQEYSNADSLISLLGGGGGRKMGRRVSSTLKHLEIRGMLSDIGFENPDKPLPCFQVLFSVFPNLETLSVSFSRHCTVGMACIEVTTLSHLRSLKISAPRPSAAQGGGMGFAFLASVVVEGAPLLSTVEIDGVYSLTIEGKSKIKRLVMEAVPDIDVEGGPRVVLSENVSVQSLVLSGMKKQEGGSCLCRAFDQEYGWTWERLRDLLASKVLAGSNSSGDYCVGGGGGVSSSSSLASHFPPSSSGGIQTLVLRELPICASAPAVLPVARAELVDALILTGGDLNFASNATSILSISQSLKTLRRLELHGLSLISFLIRRLPPRPSSYSSLSDAASPPPPPEHFTREEWAILAENAEVEAAGYGGGDSGGGGHFGEDRSGSGMSAVFDRDSHREVAFRAPCMTSLLLVIEGSDSLLRWVGPRLVPFLADILVGSPRLLDLTIRIDRSKATLKSSATMMVDWAEGSGTTDTDGSFSQGATGIDILLQGVNRLKKKYGNEVLKVEYVDPVKRKEGCAV